MQNLVYAVFYLFYSACEGIPRNAGFRDYLFAALAFGQGDENFFLLVENVEITFPQQVIDFRFDEPVEIFEFWFNHVFFSPLLSHRSVRGATESR